MVIPSPVVPADLVDVHTIITKIGPNLTSLRLDFSYHFADDFNTPNVHLCTAIRDNCQNLYYLILSFPPPDKIEDAPRASICHQLFRAPVNFTNSAGMLNLKRVEIIGHHGYCEGSSRKMLIDASEDVWATQNQIVWEASSEDGSWDHECLHTNIQIHGTSARRRSLLNRRELCCLSGTLPELSSFNPRSRKNERRLENNIPESHCNSILTLVPPPLMSYLSHPSQSAAFREIFV